MIYRAIGLMSGSSLDGLDIAFVEFQHQGGKWSFELLKADCYSYSASWVDKLKNAIDLSAREYQLLHTEYGQYIGQQVNKFIDAHQLQYKIALVASHGHTTFHLPAKKMTAQLGDGAAIAAETQLPVITDLRAMDIAFGGQGAPIVPIGEKMLLAEYDFFLNLGGIANISQDQEGMYKAFDICAANRVLNMLAADVGKDFDSGGELAASGQIDQPLLEKLNALDYYQQPYPKSLANDFGTGIVYPMIKDARIKTADALRTYTEHIVLQIAASIAVLSDKGLSNPTPKLLVTGGGAFNTFLLDRLAETLRSRSIELVVPEKNWLSLRKP